MFGCVQIYLNEGLVVSEPVNMRLNKLVNNTCDEFVDFANYKILPNQQLDKRRLYNDFLRDYPELKYTLKQRTFTIWLRAWGAYKKLRITEGHSGEIRHILYSTDSNT